MSSFNEKVESLVGRVEQNNVWRQKESFNLIPSETTPSLLVKMCRSPILRDAMQNTEQ